MRGIYIKRQLLFRKNRHVSSNQFLGNTVLHLKRLNAMYVDKNVHLLNDVAFKILVFAYPVDFYKINP